MGKRRRTADRGRTGSRRAPAQKTGIAQKVLMGCGALFLALVVLGAIAGGGKKNTDSDSRSRTSPREQGSSSGSAVGSGSQVSTLTPSKRLTLLDVVSRAKELEGQTVTIRVRWNGMSGTGPEDAPRYLVIVRDRRVEGDILFDLPKAVLEKQEQLLHHLADHTRITLVVKVKPPDPKPPTTHGEVVRVDAK